MTTRHVCLTALLDTVIVLSILLILATHHERSFHSHSTRSRPIPEVKLGRARLVVRFVRTCEARVLFVLLFFSSFFFDNDAMG